MQIPSEVPEWVEGGECMTCFYFALIGEAWRCKRLKADLTCELSCQGQHGSRWRLNWSRETIGPCKQKMLLTFTWGGRTSSQGLTGSYADIWTSSSAKAAPSPVSPKEGPATTSLPTATPAKAMGGWDWEIWRECFGLKKSDGVKMSQLQVKIWKMHFLHFVDTTWHACSEY